MPRQIKGLETVTAQETLAEIQKALTDLETAENTLATLNTQLDQAKQGSARAAELEAKVQTAEQKLSEATALITTLNAQLAAAQKGQPVDVTAIINETAAKTRAEVEKQAAADKRALEDRLAAIEEQRIADRLAAVRAEVIAEADGAIIEAMVTGSTEEEIRASAVKAKEAYAAVAAKHAAPAPRNSVPPVIHTRPKSGDPRPQGDDLATYQRTGDRKAFGAKRAGLLEAARKRFG